MNRKNLVLLAILALLIGGFVLKQHLDEQAIQKDIAQENRAVFEGIVKEQITEFAITDTEKKITSTLVKQGDRWVVKEKNNFPADKALVDKVLETLPKFRYGTQIGDEEEMQKNSFGFDKAVEVKVAGKTLVLGNPAGARLPIKVDGALYLSPSNERHVFARYDGEWRERKLFPGREPADAIGLKIAIEGRPPVEVKLGENDEATVTGIDGADPQKAKALLSAVGGLRIGSFFDAPPPMTDEVEKDKKKEKIAKGVVTVSFKNGEAATFELVGQKVKDKSDYLISKDGVLFGLSEYYFNKLGSLDLLPNAPAPIKPAPKPVKK
ncbi:MAG TPA: DUF4340 domain-containing protein [bacterium]|nr:DUF4340 domain-containing protein [bacterium]